MRRPPPEAFDLSTWPGVDTSALDAEARRRYQHRAAAIALRDKVISGKALTHGENQDGEFEEIPAHEFEELEFSFAESVEDIAGRVNRIDVVPSEN